MLSLMHGGASIDASAVAAATGGSSSGAAPASVTDSSDHRIERDDENAMRDEQEEDSDIDEGLATSLGVLKVDPDKGKSMYIGQVHWHTLLADISEVKNFYVSHKKDLEKSYERVQSSKPPTALDSPIFLLSSPPATETELRAELPAKSAITVLVSRYFNSLDTAVSIIHGPTFQQQLRNHWQDPAKSPIMWVGLVYSMLCLAMLSYHKVGDEPPEWKGRSLELAAEYRLRTVQCLVVSDYTRPVEYTVETMILYLFGEWSSRWDADLGLWLITSLITRIAFRMGYHRDAQWFSSVTPFQGEMRRRTWGLIRMADIMFSFQVRTCSAQRTPKTMSRTDCYAKVSLPTMINEQDTDTKLPHNIFDEEFGPDTKVLPPSRPITEPTPIAYMIAKTRLCEEFGNILQTVTRVKRQATYDEILTHDRKLREILDELPPHLKIQPLEGSHDPATLLIARFNINMLYQKMMCMLHRKHLIRARTNPRYAHSRRSAIEASLETLGHLRTIYRECQPTGRLRTMKWYAQATSKDTLLPTMLVVLDLHHDNLASASGKRQDSQTMYFWTQEQRAEMISALESVRDIWKSFTQDTVEAFKAGGILDIMLAKIKNPSSYRSCSDPTKQENLFGDFSSADLQPEHSAAMTLGMMSSGLTPNYQSPGGTSYPPLDIGSGLTPNFPVDLMAGAPANAASPFSMFNNIGNTGDMALDQNFDWVSHQINTRPGHYCCKTNRKQAAFENYTQNVNFAGEGSAFGFFPDTQQQQQSPQGASTDSSFSFMNMNTPGTGKST